MHKGIHSVHRSLIFRLIFLVGLVLSVSIFAWACFNINYQKNITAENVAAGADRLANTIRLGTHYAMMSNSREDINEIIRNIGRQEGIENIRILDGQGRIKFSSLPDEVDLTADIRADAGRILRKDEPPMEMRTRIFDSSAGYRLIGVRSPIYNEANCSSAECHIHPRDERVLGTLDVVVSLEKTDQSVHTYERRVIALAVISFLATSVFVGVVLLIFVNYPIRRLVARTRLPGRTPRVYGTGRRREDEIGELAEAFDRLGREIGEKEEELSRQRDEYQELFETVPCYITVQDKELRLLKYNRSFAAQFAPRPGRYCYEVYKRRMERCEPCPVITTFEDGMSHSSEETGVSMDGVSYWMVCTSPIRDHHGDVTAVMETSFDITHVKRLEDEIRKSEAKYRDIFNQIPTPVFVLDRHDLTVLDCNESMQTVYRRRKEDMVGVSFLEFFEPASHRDYALEIRTTGSLIQTGQVTADGRIIYANIRVSPSEYLGREAFLVTVSDVTRRLLADQQLVQTGKMSALGEMTAGIAHELNQPLAIIKTASRFLMRKIRKMETIEDDILKTMAEEIDGQVDRASKIVNHLREFGRKSDVKKEKVRVNDALRNVLGMFGRQLKLRGIEVVREFGDDLPSFSGDLNRFEQVLINLIINARDAIMEKSEKTGRRDVAGTIFLKTLMREGQVTIEVKDTGPGIPKSVLDRIFEPFFTTKEVGKGTGLGLSISHGIVRDYEGSIRVETRENEGTTFIVQFPACSDA